MRHPDPISERVFRSRRFLLAAAALAVGAMGMFMDKDITAFAVLVGTVLAGYGFTRSKFAGGGEDA